MLLMPPIVTALSNCVFEGLFLTSLSFIYLGTVTEVQLTGHLLDLMFTCVKHRFLLCKLQFLVDIIEKYVEKCYQKNTNKCERDFQGCGDPRHRKVRR